jgi:hypothetical protein
MTKTAVHRLASGIQDRRNLMRMPLVSFSISSSLRRASVGSTA